MKDLEWVLSQFREKVVMTLGNLASLREWSEVTVRRYLRQWGVFTSYNCNGRYYVLRDIPRFDERGLWDYQGIRFSRSGNLTRTIINIVGTSDSGLAAAELSGLLGYEIHPVLARLTKKGELKRERYSGRYIYFSTKPMIGGVQKKARCDRESPSVEVLSATTAVVLLVEKIKHPQMPVSGLAGRLAKQGFNVTTGTATEFLDRHGLLKKT